MNFDKMWQEQEEFNRLLRPAPETFEARTALTKELALNLMAQLTQLLECTGWRSHRRQHVRQNAGQIRSQLADIGKVWVSLTQTWGITPAEMEEDFWGKSMVCRQRYSEEWVQTLDRPCVILDLDNVLCDYAGGFVQWLVHAQDWTPAQTRTFWDAVHRQVWINAESLELDNATYQRLKHEFRSSGAKARLPAMPGAIEFVAWCRRMGWQTILLTSRPIDTYPNLYGDTLAWLTRYGMQIDHVWWGTDKAEKMISRDLAEHVVFVVDDDKTFAIQYAKAHVPVYWLTHSDVTGDVILDTEWGQMYRASSLRSIVHHQHLLRGENPNG